MIVFAKNRFLGVVFLFSFLMQGQTDTIKKDTLHFVNYKENYLHFYSEQSNLDTFYKKLDTLLTYKKGKVRILQMGGSHIQAEIWPDQVRDHFLQLAPNINGGRGFVFPFKVAKTWNPKNHQICYSGDWQGYKCSVNRHHEKWGLSGLTAVTNDIATFQMAYKSDSITNYKFDRIKIFHDLDSTSLKINLVSDAILNTYKNQDMGYTEFVLNDEQDSLAVEIRKTDSIQNHFNLYGLSLENSQPGLVYTSVGVNGAKTKSFLRNDLMQKQLEVVKPDLVIFCIGINDAYYSQFKTENYEANYDQLIAQIQLVNPKVNFLFVSNNDSFYKRKYPNKRVLAARNVMVKLAKKYNAGFWDLFEIMGGLGSIEKWENAGYAKADKLHFTDKGYQLIGDLMFEAIIKDYEKYKLENN